MTDQLSQQLRESVLLEALKAVYHEYEQQYDGTSNAINIPPSVVAQVRAAIAAVEGSKDNG